MGSAPAGTRTGAILVPLRNDVRIFETNRPRSAFTLRMKRREGYLAIAALKLDDERALPRTRVLLNGTLMTPDGVVRIRIRDVSNVGAQIWSERPVSEGCDAVLKRGRTFAAARVVWADDQWAGLRFYRELALEPFLRD